MKKFIWEELPPRVDGGRTYQRFILRIHGNLEFMVTEHDDHKWTVSMSFYFHHSDYADGRSTNGVVSKRRADIVTEAMMWCEQWIASIVPQIADVTYRTGREVWYRT